jgi:protein TonB
VARAAAIDGGEWTGAMLALVAGIMRPRARPQRDRDASISPAYGGWVIAVVVSLAFHAAIVAAATLSFGDPQPTDSRDAIAVELVVSTGVAPPPLPERESSRVEPAPRDDATPDPIGARAETAPQPTNAADATTPATAKPPDMAAAAIRSAPKSVDEASATDIAPPASVSLSPIPDVAPAIVASVAPAPPPQAASAPPEADFAAAPMAPHVEPGISARPPTVARIISSHESAARPFGARASANAPAPAPARGAVELAAYRDALFAKISSLVRYPEAARERGVTGVATVRFALDGAGAVTLADLTRSSGDRALDDEAVAAVRRAAPLPAPPEGAPRAYSAPIRFELR